MSNEQLREIFALGLLYLVAGLMAFAIGLLLNEFKVGPIPGDRLEYHDPQV